MKAFPKCMLVFALAVTAGCRVDAPNSAQSAASSGDATTAAVAKTALTTTSTTSTTTTSSTSTSTLASSVTPIADNFDTSAGITTASWGLPASMGSDPVGAFRFNCGAGQLLYDDPIMYPGQPGKSHLHQFYGNLGVNASSTYTSIRTTGDSTCAPTPGAPVNRSGYWMPAMLDGAGNVVRPDRVLVYYKRLPKTNSRCTRTNVGAQGDCVGAQVQATDRA